MSESQKNPLPPWTAIPVYITGVLCAVLITAASVYFILLLASETLSNAPYVDEYILSTMLVLLYAGMIFIASFIIRHSRLRLFAVPAMALTMLCCIAGVTLCMVMIWAVPLRRSGTDDVVGIFALALLFITFALLHNGAFSCMFIRSGAHRIAVIIVAALAWLIALPMAGALLWYIAFDSERALNSIVPAAAMLSMVVLIASGILPGMIRHSNRKWEEARDSVSRTTTLSLDCPKCQSPQRLDVGHAKCTACGQLLNIELEEPRCECGYLIYQLTGTTCPECGRDLSEKVGTLFPMNFDDPPADPLDAFDQWFNDAQATDLPNPNALTLATVDPDGKPSARIVLLKEADAQGLVFYTNRLSRKGEALKANPVAALVFHWDVLNRQVRVEGSIALISDEESDAYFASRPRGSQIGAWASKQSMQAKDRAELDSAFAEVEARYEGQSVPRPPHWGGYRLTPHAWEFWQGHPNRLHDRLLYVRDDANEWKATRLFP